MPETILIADDHESSLSALEGLLALEGFEVVTAPDGEAALTAFHRGQPDLLLLDVKMPRLSGFEVCRWIKNDADTRLIPIILITAMTATEDRLGGDSGGGRRLSDQAGGPGTTDCAGEVVAEAEGLHG
jgi:CheY-like chemotaxis protein